MQFRYNKSLKSFAPLTENTENKWGQIKLHLGNEHFKDAKSLIRPYLLSFSNMWKLSFREFTLKTLKETVSREWHVPEKQIELRPESSDTIKYALPKGKTIGYPTPE